MSAPQESARVLSFRPVPKGAEPLIVEPPPAQPFVKWAGGKRSLVSALAPHFPDEMGTYWEPFVGGGAVFFAFAKRIKHAILSDTNEERDTRS